MWLCRKRYFCQTNECFQVSMPGHVAALIFDDWTNSLSSHDPDAKTFILWRDLFEKRGSEQREAQQCAGGYVTTYPTNPSPSPSASRSPNTMNGWVWVGVGGRGSSYIVFYVRKHKESGGGWCEAMEGCILIRNKRWVWAGVGRCGGVWAGVLGWGWDLRGNLEEWNKKWR